MISVLLFVGVFLATLDADSVSWRMAVSATGSRPFERRLLTEHRYNNPSYCSSELFSKLYTLFFAAMNDVKMCGLLEIYIKQRTLF